MKKTLKVSDIINKAQNMTKYTQVSLDDAQQRAVNAVTTVIGSGGLSVGVGPPGTGKTVVFTITQSIVFDRVDKDEVMVYIAPMNRLVEESATHASALLLRKGISEEDLKASIRVYGSWFKAEPLNQDVKLVFTTPYQPSMLKELLRIKKTIHIMVDEASTTPLHGPFIALSMAMARALEDKRIDWLESFSVIGDPMQAIAEGYSFHEKFELLIVSHILLYTIPDDEKGIVRQDPSKIFEIASKHAEAYGIKYAFLDNTYRIPKPTELLVSEPFYNRLLRGVIDYKTRLKEIKREIPSIKREIQQRLKITSKEVAGTIDNALDSHIPIVYLKDEGAAYAYAIKRGQQKVNIWRRPQEIEELDISRAALACEVAAYLIAVTVPQINIEILTPYIEMKTQMEVNLKRLIAETMLEQEIENRVRVSTVHAALGSEADIVIAVLGKEYIGDETKTIYFQTPELVNVQFSRHRRLVVVIGNIERLAKNFNKVSHMQNVARICNALEELKQQQVVIQRIALR